MAKTRQAPLDGPVWIRTYPVTFLHDVTEPPHDHAWHQLTFATRGHLEVITDDARHIVPADRAVWVPAGTQHAEVMRAPISMRSIYISRLSFPAAPAAPERGGSAPDRGRSAPERGGSAPDRLRSAPDRLRSAPDRGGSAPDRGRSAPDLGRSAPDRGGSAPDLVRTAPDRVRTIAVTPLLRELILHISRIGALDRRKPEQARLVGVLLDQLAAARDVSLALPSPRDPRARRFAELVTGAPGSGASIAALARRAGASLRTIERCFLRETGVAVGDWRRRVRLFHALRLLEDGAAVTDVALDVGYASTSAFSQAFARQFGRSPSGRPRAG